MAQRVEIQLVDDVDGSTATETVRFGVDGSSYEIDLNNENAKELRDAYAGYIGSARRVAGSASNAPRRRASSSSGRSRGELEQVRAWARENGHEVSDRGRVPLKVLEAYDASR
ncbi:Lsr2 family protein [Tersicoccus sp. Bi-70]|uniref:histone-like nucleoid-structuring protein Lsr2 n=1 Tax=Tersicoccus sp. Bi-70 TaxID=1897634 RepID=UPI000976592A|nr:Lsr2 family protein [Tersicoccus sp. Bi-70]OMH37113.1 hypothetical protein BGP79_15655 [Tersicoccus sp. Bi-70]